MQIAFAGTPEFALPALNALAAAPHTLVGVLTQPDRPAGRGRELRASPIKQRALQLGLPIDQPERLASAEQQAALRSWRPDLLVVVAYGLILPPEVLAIPSLGCLNIHASLLPRWRGAAPIQRALLAGDDETGVAIMRLEAGLDTGSVYAERRVAIGEHAYAATLHDQLASLGAAALMEVVDELAAGRAVARPQSSAGITYAHKIEKSAARIDWRQDALQIERQVRAFNPWPVAETKIGDAAGSAPAIRLRIWRARAHSALAASAAEMPGLDVPALATPPSCGMVLGLHAGRIAVRCGQGVLGLESVQVEGRRAIEAVEFWRAMPLTGRRLV